MATLSNEKKGELYDDYIRQSETLQRENSKIKSEFVGNIPPEKQEIIDANVIKINALVKKLEGLFKD